MYTKIRNKTGFFLGGGDLKFFGKGQGGFTKIFDRRRGGGGVVFSPLT